MTPPGPGQWLQEGAQATVGAGRQNLPGGLLGHLQLQGFWRPCGVSCAREPQICQRPLRCSPTLGSSDMIKDLSWLLRSSPGRQAGAHSLGRGLWAAAPISGLGSPNNHFQEPGESPPSGPPFGVESAGPGVGVGDRGAPRMANGHSLGEDRRAL